MVSNPGTSLDTRRIRHLNSPRGLEVQTDSNGLPVRLRLGGMWHDVSPAREPWRIYQLWWRSTAVRRDYFRVLPQDGPPVTIYHDLASGEWARQGY